MGHMINGFIANAENLSRAARHKSNCHLCFLEQGFAFLPVFADMVDPQERVSSMQEFYGLTDSLSQWAMAESTQYSIVYIETDYFGGTGAQAAISWRDGQISFGPLMTGDGPRAKRSTLLDGAVNQCLRHLGVLRGDASDEFDAMGLGRHRSNESFIAANRA
ncbi:MAG: hypothetical protein JWL69_3659 [Phycisphaerales bacterium]|nr:hypothetical protein [Phycisphaerales bacterium]